MTDLDDLLIRAESHIAFITREPQAWWDDEHVLENGQSAIVIERLAAAVRALRDRPCPHVETGDDGTSFCTLAEIQVRDLRGLLNDREQEAHEACEAADHYRDRYRKLLDKHRATLAVPDRPGGTDNSTSDPLFEGRIVGRVGPMDAPHLRIATDQPLLLEIPPIRVAIYAAVPDPSCGTDNPTSEDAALCEREAAGGGYCTRPADHGGLCDWQYDDG